MCTHVLVSLHMLLCVCAHVCNVCLCVIMCACDFVYAHVCLCTCVYLCVFVHAPKCLCVLMCPLVCVYLFVCLGGAEEQVCGVELCQGPTWFTILTYWFFIFLRDLWVSH